MKIKIGDHVAFNSLADKVWFEVKDIIDKFTLVVREVNTNNSTQRIDRSYVKEVRSK